MGIVNEYLEYTKKWKNEYGEKTIVLMQVGAFLEVYALKDKDGNYHGSNIEEFSLNNDMIIAKKAKMFVNKLPVVMAGFQMPQLEKYTKKLQEQGYTIVIYRQDTPGSNTTRSLAEIISPGTFFSQDNDNLSNTSMSIWIEYSKSNKIMGEGENIIFGIATLDIYTGKTTLYQSRIKYHHNPCTYDNIERLVAIHKPSECLIVSNLDSNILNDIITFVGLDEIKTHIINPKNKDSHLSTYAINSEKQTYQLETFKKYYPNLSEETIITAIMQSHCIAAQAFVLLLGFICEHSPNLGCKLSVPIFDNDNNRLILANHSLGQLNIIEDSRYKGKMCSVGSLLNNCITAMGKRKFNYNLHHPITNIDMLTNSYNTTESLLKNKKWELYRENLKGVHDIEKFKRKLVLQKITPKDISIFLEDLHKLNKIVTHVDKKIISSPKKTITTLIKYLENIFDKKKSAFIDDMSLEKLGGISPENLAFIKKGNSEKIDNLMDDCLNSRNKLIAIANKFSEIISTIDKGKTTTHIKVHETPKSDPILLGTKRRCGLLQHWINSQDNQLTNLTIEYLNNTGVVEKFTINLKDIKTAKNGSNKTNDYIYSQEINEICLKVQNSIDKLVFEISSFYNIYLVNFLNKIDNIDIIIDFAIVIDVLQSKAYIAHKFNYCKPSIIEDTDKSYVNFKEIRHPLIEHIQTNELYVTNNLALGLGENSDGLLLYGTNAVGKTSFIKSVGIAIVMAQAGLYVPCSSFVYYPYTCLFTRILGNDNLFKGLSTFAVEMSELRTILTLADKNSLILGDELCSGTESDSALSIFTAGLENLHEKRSTFLFATHFHEVTNYDEVKNLERIKFMHMKVSYNREKDILVYDRKLKNGSGDTMYGLEVCKSLNLPDEFLKRAHDIRFKYNKSSRGVLQQTSTHFNSKKLGGLCEICKNNESTEVHHLQHQVHANKDNKYISTFHKNHPANLVNICEDCHNEIHRRDKQQKIVKTSNGHIIVDI